ncbi:MAG: arginine deiminase [Chloroflexi bacterium]|nr:arginine deiminase [Chloroflexota bacterium]MBI3731912.1 arginine deiminase [Chloroflexota bacterium]
MTPTWGAQSMVAPLKRVLVNRPAETEREARAWREFGYYHAPDSERARQEHAQFVELLVEAGADVCFARNPQPERLDSIFVFDAALVTREGAVICRMGKPLRRGEEHALAQELLALGIPILATIRGSGTLEGGDTLWLDEQTLVVGRSYRTNAEGIDQLRRALDGIATVIAVPLPHWRGRGEILHLLSLISPVSERLAVVYPPLMPIPLVELLEARGIKMLAIPDEEFKTQASNILATAPNRVIMLAGNARTAHALRERGVEVWEYEGQEISFNRDGGPTCLTRPLWRSND